MSAPGKENKEKKSSKDEGSASALKKITEELAAIRADIDALKVQSRDNPAASIKPDLAPSPEIVRNTANQSVKLQKLLSEPNDAVISIAYAYRLKDAEGSGFAASDEILHYGLEEIVAVDDARVARLGYALSSPPKVAVLRILLTSGPQSAAQIGEKASLTTGSLYHHLRELTHATVIESTVRNRFELTEIGRQVTLLLFAQAGRVLTAG